MLRFVWWLLALIVFVLFLLAGNKLKQTFLTSSFHQIAELNDDCDLRVDTCIASFNEQQQLSFSLSPSDIPLLVPIQATVTLNGIQAEKVLLDIVGLNMDMGYNRPQLVNNDRAFLGNVILPVCTLERMEWEARVIVYTLDDNVLMAPFRFYTQQKL